jgi:pimeloyl-ACP methyl ester carboxylesterase
MDNGDHPIGDFPVTAVEHSRPTFLLVHGAFHGAWCWAKLQAALGADRHAARTVDLPTAVRTATPTKPHSGVDDDAEVIRAQLRGNEGPVVVVAHSYGGVPVTQAIADAANVSHVVYLAAFPLEVGESAFGFQGIPIHETSDGVIPVPENAETLLYADLSAEEAERAVRHLVPQSLRSCREQVTKAGWRTVPSTYIVCEQDQALPLQDQEKLAARANATHRLASSHSPFLSMPGELASLLTKIV